MHFTRRLALSSALVGLVAMALPWKYQHFISANGKSMVIEYWGVDSLRAFLLAGILAIGGLISGLGDRDEPLTRRAAMGLIVSSSCALALALVFLISYSYSMMPGGQDSDYTFRP